MNEAKIAEITIMANEKLEKLMGAEGEELSAVRDELTKNLIREKAKVEENTERKIEKIRNAE
ncbi:hypothetical protein MNBD_NITROSPINAE04-222 [hydrothermal vent metagenome]|uniref:Uncharacterized protein n=1 Tax=hydrothermal vent metagenome TaxID=652676 RepID=A0A3B1C4G2_9ZZZZ